MVPLLIGLGVAALVGVAIICISVSYYLNRSNLKKALRESSEIKQKLDSGDFEVANVLDENPDEVMLELEDWWGDTTKVKIESDGNAFYRGDKITL